MNDMGITTKRIKGLDYVYFGCYDRETGTKKYKSCGPASKRESMAKAVDLERSYLERRQAMLAAEADRVRAKLRGLERLG